MITDVIIYLYGSTYGPIVLDYVECKRCLKTQDSVCEFIKKLEQTLGVNYNIFYVDPISGKDFDIFKSNFQALFTEYKPSHEAKDRINDLLPLNYLRPPKRTKRTKLRAFGGINGRRTHRLNICKKSFRRHTPLKY